jgi:hypothetical protein
MNANICRFSDLKNTSDDALPNYLNSLGFKQSHYYTDVRLAIGYVAVTIAGALFYADWKLGWDVTRAWTLPAVAAYMVLNGAFTYWLFRVEKGTVYVGTKNGVTLEISTSSSTTDGPTYSVIAKTRASSSAPWTVTKLSSPLSNWFSADGYFVAKPFQRFLARGIPIVGQADPKNASTVEEPEVKPQPASATGQQQFNVNISNLPDVLKHIQAQGNTASKRR